MSERWSPGSSDWIRVLDYGRAAVWVRPEDDGATIAVYLGGYWDDVTADIWTVRVLRGSSLLNTIMDKPHRVRFVEQPDDDNWLKVVWYKHERTPISHQGHPRLNHNRHVWVDPLPRRVHEAIGYGER